MCLAIPMEVMQVEGDTAEVEAAGTRRKIRTDLLPGLKAGDYVLVHAGFAIERVEPDQARKDIELIEELIGEIP
jgi:hydrogenase expression/formation protein HypC